MPIEKIKIAENNVELREFAYTLNEPPADKIIINIESYGQDRINRELEDQTSIMSALQSKTPQQYYDERVAKVQSRIDDLNDTQTVMDGGING